MSLFQICSILICLGSILIKGYFAHRITSYQARIVLEHKSYNIAKKELKLATTGYQKAMSDKKKLETQHNSLKRNLTQIQMVHQKMEQDDANLRKQLIASNLTPT